MKNTLEGINNRLNEADKWISEREYRVVEITTAKQKIENKKKLEPFKRPLSTRLAAATFQQEESKGT